MSRHRMIRIGEEIKRELSQMIRDEIKDPRVKGLISITGVDVTNDLRYAKVYVSLFGQDEESTKKTMEGLENSKSYLRCELAQRLQLRYTPELIIKEDASIAYGARINQIISELDRKEGKESHD
jgi:ribosome-binding factor A